AHHIRLQETTMTESTSDDQIAQRHRTGAAAGPPTAPARSGPTGWWRFFLYSGLGIFMFFVPVPIGEDTTIPLDHLVNWVRDLLGDAAPWVVLAIILGGAIYPFATGRWRRSTTYTVFALLNVVGLVAAVMLVFDFGPAFLFDP